MSKNWNHHYPAKTFIHSVVQERTFALANYTWVQIMAVAYFSIFIYSNSWKNIPWKFCQIPKVKQWKSLEIIVCNVPAIFRERWVDRYYEQDYKKQFVGDKDLVDPFTVYSHSHNGRDTLPVIRAVQRDCSHRIGTV